jgi:GNAT superfamily N-acetyltransferase
VRQHNIVRPGGNTTLPAGYPRVARLHDGRGIVLAPLTPAYSGQLAQAFREADPATLYHRFCGPPPRLTPELLRHLTELDFDRRFALVACDGPEHGIAIGRYEATRKAGVAEVAVVVKPQWRRLGIATILVRALAEAALERGFVRLSATFLGENRPVTALLGEAHAGRTIAEGIGEGVVRIEEALRYTTAPERRPVTSRVQPRTQQPRTQKQKAIGWT